MAELSTMIEDLSSNLEDPTKKTSGNYATLPGFFAENGGLYILFFASLLM